MRSYPSLQMNLHPCTYRKHDVNSVGYKNTVEKEKWWQAGKGLERRKRWAGVYQNTMCVYAKFSNNKIIKLNLKQFLTKIKEDTDKLNPDRI